MFILLCVILGSVISSLTLACLLWQPSETFNLLVKVMENREAKDLPIQKELENEYAVNHLMFTLFLERYCLS